MAGEKIKVKTGDDEIIEVDLDIAKQWQPIKNIFDIADSAEAKQHTFDLSNVYSEALRKIIDWSQNHKQDEVDTRPYFPGSSDYDKKFFDVPQEMIFELIMASNYLGMTELLDLGCKKVADMIKGKTPEQVRQTFNIPNDLPPLNEVQPATTMEN